MVRHNVKQLTQSRPWVGAGVDEEIGSLRDLPAARSLWVGERLTWWSSLAGRHVRPCLRTQ
ncbi:hypothetical protein CBM2609_U10045 [Cupriavidus taiwanensis]|nr:hypothetical protein CBM2604_U10048 [Cupriavidus taiwanensis]SOZ34449.1 hypothetical protein CBM2609_U10045 [Cupriavidus taiwanensis]SOZ53038.1 hypothetical protein CBM2610_U10047 [Cupriavidus taiwanensis]